MTGIISSFEVLSKRFKAVKQDEKDARVPALRHYFSNGGVISVAGTEKDGWPELSYPSRARLQQQLKEIQQKKELFQKKKSDWNQAYRNAQWYELKSHAKKLVDPLYWKHVRQSVTDEDYRKDAQKIGLPAHMVSEKRYRPMVDMFVNDVEYRKQLAETVENSIVYRENKKVARYANELQEFRKSVSTNRLKEINQKLKEIEEDEKSIQALLQWAKK